MAATESYGSGIWGIATPQGAVITHNVDYTYTSDKKTLKDEVGNDIGVTYYNARVDVTIDGAVPKTGTIDDQVGMSITLANALDSHLFETGTGIVIVDEINRKKVNEDYETISLKATVYPYIVPEA